MPDSNDDTLFSQDDIDKLLNAETIEEAEQSIANGDEDIDKFAGAADDEDIIGELSQDDIDRLLNASSSDSDEPEEKPAAPESSKIAINDDLDTIAEPTEIASLKAESEYNEEDDEDDDLGELSQDDIEKLLNSSSDIDSPSGLDKTEPASYTQEAEKASADSSENGADSEDAAFDLISQDDIDKLMATEDIDLPEPDSIEPDISLDNTVVLDQESDEELLDPSEAWSIKDCFITQDTIDELINKAAQDDDLLNSDALESEDQSQEADPFKVNLSEDESEPEFNLDTSDDISGSDLDDLFKDADGDMDALLNDISQDDIDGFLKDSDELTSTSDGGGSEQNIVSSESDNEDGVRNVISQDDIDALLAGTDEEDEDILADMEMDEDLKRSSVPVQNVESPLPEDDDAQVILEEADESSTTTLADGTVRQLAELVDVDEKKPVKKRFMLKVITIFLIVLTLMAGSVAGVYFMFFKEKVDNLLTSSQKAVTLENREEVKTEVPDMAIQESQELTPGTMTLENFMVVTPNRQDGITYISVDIAIDYAHSTVFDAINSRLPYYRGVIYNAIDTALKSDKGDKLTESELLEIVQNALKESLLNMKITKVSFINFKTG